MYSSHTFYKKTKLITGLSLENKELYYFSKHTNQLTEELIINYINHFSPRLSWLTDMGV